MIYHNHHYGALVATIEEVNLSRNLFSLKLIHFLLFCVFCVEVLKKREEETKNDDLDCQLDGIVTRKLNFLLTHVVTHKFNNWCDRKLTLSIEH